MRERGNVKSNEIYEFSVPKELIRIDSDSDHSARVSWLERKYVEGRFRKDFPPPTKSPRWRPDLITPSLMKECALQQLGEDPEYCQQLSRLLFDL